MKKGRKNCICIVLGILCCVYTGDVFSAERKSLFDRGWRFFRGELTGAEDPFFNDSSWRLLDLPHDWSVEHLPDQRPDTIVGPFSRVNPDIEDRFRFANGNTVGGEGWYRNTFVISAEEAGKRHELYFEGIYNHSEVWVNGHKAYHNIYGYTSFRFDITPYCKPPGEVNVVAVRVVNPGRNSRWYSGSGIYRYVWMIRTSPSHIDDWGVFVTTTEVKNNRAVVSLSADVINGESAEGRYKVDVALLSPQGDVVAQETSYADIASRDMIGIPFVLTIENPRLWSPDTPDLYHLRISLWKADEKQDELSLPFGIRTIAFSAERGFELNGIPTKLKGGCIHHDNGLLGAAAFDRAEERKIEILKASGFNAIRTSHNPMSESLMNACDRLGMLVINEAFDQWRGRKNPEGYFLYFDEWSAHDIRAMVLRDRNRPSVIMWSIGNEIYERRTESGIATAKYLRDEVHKYDTTRPVTAGINSDRNKQGDILPRDTPFQYQDVSGYNYMWQFYEEDHAVYPKRVIYGSESVAKEAFQNWNQVEKHPYVIGDFIWTAIDYLGESGLGNTVEVNPEANVHQFMDWPWFNAWCGDLDILGEKKPQSYYRDILWNVRKISMAVEAPAAEGKIRKVSFWGWPEEQLSWTFPGMENKTMKVNVYTRAPKVRLYLNDIRIAEKSVSGDYTASFDVRYQPGTLRAVEINGETEGESVFLKTAGEAAALRLTADRTELNANGQDLAFILIELVDRNGNVVSHADREIEISQFGAGSVIGSGNASPTDMASFGSLTPSLFRGKAMVVIRAGYEPGEIKLNISSQNLPTAMLIIKTN